MERKVSSRCQGADDRVMKLRLSPTVTGCLESRETPMRKLNIPQRKFATGEESPTPLGLKTVPVALYLNRRLLPQAIHDSNAVKQLRSASFAFAKSAVRCCINISRSRAIAICISSARFKPVMSNELKLVRSVDEGLAHTPEKLVDFLSQGPQSLSHW